METLRTSRLVLTPTPLRVLKRRLEHESFTDAVDVEGESVQVSFPSEWPGDALVLFPMMIAALEANPETDDWSVMVLERVTGVAVGQMGFKGPPDEKGRVEIGYGINASYEGRGYATEGVKALTLWASGQPRVEHIVAECLEDNLGSLRVLEKAGFGRTGEHQDEEGLLILWQYPKWLL